MSAHEHSSKNAHTEAPVHIFRLNNENLEAHDAHAHVGHVLTFLWHGSIKMEHGTRINIEGGHIAVIPAGMPHRIIGGTNLTLVGVAFCSSCIQLTEREPLMQAFRMVRHGAFPAFKIDVLRKAHIEHLLSYLEEEVASPSRHSLEIQKALLVLILGEVDRTISSLNLAKVQPNDVVSNALRYIEEHARDAISLVDVASSVGRTPSHVAKCVKSATGHTVGQWIASRRVMEAALLLIHTDLNLDAITEHVGWKDTTYLIRQFKKYYGDTPSAWRRKQSS